jgi:hypothetical protein
MRINTRTFFSAAVLVVMSLAFAGTTMAVADDSDDVDPMASRDKLVRTLLFESSAARKVELSGNEAAMAKRAEAIKVFEAASRHENSELRDEQYNRAVALLYEAASMATSAADSDDKVQRDLDNRQQSLDALLSAHERIMDEKNSAEVHEALLEEIAADRLAAEALLKDGKTAEAKTHIDRAYVATKLSVERARTGETLLRELSFDTPKDEYEYELDRNDTHRMLLSVLLDDKMKNERIRNRVDEFVAASEKLRVQALAFAGNKEFKLAIQTMEASTKELVKAIRSAGVYIPG